MRSRRPITPNLRQTRSLEYNYPAAHKSNQSTTNPLYFVRSGRVVPSGYGGYVGLRAVGGGGYYRSLRASDSDSAQAYYLSVGTWVNTADDSHGYGDTSRYAGFPLRCLAS